MIKRIVFVVLVLLVGLVSFQPFPAAAQPNRAISLEEGKVILPGSDIGVVSMEGETVYAVVSYQKEYRLLLSRNKGGSWREIVGQGLPKKEKFISLRVLVGELDVVALATTDAVYLSPDGGNHFQSLRLPRELTARGEKISSLAITEGDPTQILIGVLHPSQGKFAEEGVYLWGLEGRHEWVPQGMRPTWGGRGYRADVTSVVFLNSIILAVATGEDGTFLNVGYLSGMSTSEAEWNRFEGWPIEIAEGVGLSPTEAEILSSKLVFPRDLDLEDLELWSFYVFYNTRSQTLDDVYKIENTSVRRLSIPDYPEIVSLDSLDYIGSYSDGSLAVGVTSKDRKGRNQVQVYYFSTEEERFDSLNWSKKTMRIPDTENCQVFFSADFSRSGIIFAAVSGQNSSFAQSEKSVLVPVSLLDIVGGISQLFPSPRFSTDRTLLLSYGNENVLRVRLTEDFQIEKVERILFIPERFDPSRIKIEQLSEEVMFVLEPETDKFWLTKNDGLSWSERKIRIEMVDIIVVDGKVMWLAGKDSLVYRSENTGGSWLQKITSGARWLQGIELGPTGKILVVGGINEEGVSDMIYIVDKEALPEPLPMLPVPGKDIRVVYSPEDDAVYYGIGGHLYRLVIEEAVWEKIAESSEGITKITPSS